MLVVLSGLPGVGKSTVARELAAALGAVWLRIDSIEQAIVDSGVVPSSVEDAGYRAAYAAAADNLRLGRDVVADSVNPIAVTREAWRGVADGAGAQCLDVELVCGDAAEHRRRVETRTVDIPTLTPPTWREVVERAYDAWDGDRLTIDTARCDPADAVALIVDRVRTHD